MELLIWDATQKDGPRNAEDRTSDANNPLDTAEACDTKSNAADKHDRDLTCDHDSVNAEKPIVLQDSLEDVESVVESSAIELVKNLHPNKRIEDNCIQLKLDVLIADIVAKNAGASKVQCKRESELVDALPNNHLPHGRGEKRCRLWRRFSIQDLVGRCISGPIMDVSANSLILTNAVILETYSAKAAKVSMMRLTQSSCTAFRTGLFSLLERADT